MISSVTVCSTWIRGFISMKTYWPFSSSRNSTVPAQLYPMCRANATASAQIWSRSSGARFGRGRQFDDLLVAALHAAVALVEVDHVAVRVGQDLHLDVAWPQHRLLEEDRRVAERRLGFAPGGFDRFGQRGGVVDAAHAAAPAAGNGLDEQREPHTLRRPATSSSTEADGADDVSTGSPASRAAAIARALLPVSSSTSALGPTNVMPAAAHAAARSGFSDKNP